MSDSLHQKRGREEYWIELGEKDFSYRSRVNGNDGKATVPFELVTRNTTVHTRTNPFFRNASLYFAVLTVLSVAFGFLVNMDVRVALLWALIAGACYLVFRLAGASYEVFPLTDGRVFRVLRNAPNATEYGAFRTELFARRDKYLLERYARINIERPAGLELRRIDWLHNEGVLKDEAYATIVETINDHADQ